MSVHLLTSSAATRNTEAAALVGFISSNLQAGDYLVIGGDFNTDTRDEPCFTTFQAVSRPHRGPILQTRVATTARTPNRSKPYDWVLPSASLHRLEIPLVFGSSVHPAGLVFDSRVYAPLTDAPVCPRGRQCGFHDAAHGRDAAFAAAELVPSVERLTRAHSAEARNAHAGMC